MIGQSFSKILNSQHVTMSQFLSGKHGEIKGVLYEQLNLGIFEFLECTLTLGAKLFLEFGYFLISQFFKFLKNR
jgi:hypothetical protein